MPAGVSGFISFHLMRSIKFHNSRSELFHRERKRTISLKTNGYVRVQTHTLKRQKYLFCFRSAFVRWRNLGIDRFAGIGYASIDERSIMREGHYTTGSDLIFSVHFFFIIHNFTIRKILPPESRSALIDPLSVGEICGLTNSSYCFIILLKASDAIAFGNCRRCERSISMLSLFLVYLTFSSRRIFFAYSSFF